MSIFDGKNGYDSTNTWVERTARALAERGPFYKYEMGLDDTNPCVDWIKGHLYRRPGADVLEVGSGFGKWSKVLEGRYKTFTGVEIVPARVQHATDLYGSDIVHFHQLTPDWDLGRKFDVVLSVTVIQHLNFNKGVEVLHSIQRHLSDDGVALLAEGRIYDITLEEAERLYADPKNSDHMIPKPLAMLQEAVPELSWDGEIGRFILRQKV